MKTRLRQALISGLIYGLGLLAGTIVAELIALGVRPERFLSGQQGARLVQGILLAFLLAGLSGFIGGVAGGWTLPVAGRAKGRWGYAWKSGITIGIGYGALIFPVLLVISILSFYEISTVPPIIFSLIFGVMGLVFGLVVGGILGTWTLRRFYGPAFWMSALGFGLGGAGLGYGLHRYLLSVTHGKVATGSFDWLMAGIFLFGAFGGAGLGLVFQRADDSFDVGSMLVRRLSAKRWVRRVAIFGGILFVLALVIRPVLAGIGDLLTPIDAQLSPILDLETTGTHWLDDSAVAGTQDLQPTVTSDGGAKLIMGWAEDSAIAIRQAEWSAEDQNTTWQTAERIAVGLGGSRSDVQIAMDQGGRILVVWVESDNVGGTDIMTSLCENDSCSEPVSISSAVEGTCRSPLGPINRHPTLALDSGGTLMLVWENEIGVLPYVIWQIDESALAGTGACVNSTAAENGRHPRLSAHQNGAFVLVFETPAEEIRSSRYFGGEWDAKSQLLGNGRSPEIFIDGGDEVHAVWCTEDQVNYWFDGDVESAATSTCTGRPVIGMDEDEQVHIVWASDQVPEKDSHNTVTPVILESVASGESWTPAAVVAHSRPGTQPDMAVAGDGSLHLIWSGTQDLKYAAQVQYRCDGEDLSPFSQIMYDVGRQEKYIPAEDPLPYCRNQYDQLIFTPNPNPAFSEQTPTKNGAFDVVADLIRGAEYEVLYSTMWYDSAVKHDSPGAVIAGAVADLYEMVRANPEQYPRGMTVRILLDNPPEAAQGEATGQMWSLLGDLRHAGVEKMVDNEIGWRLEVADYEGNMPHSHVKSVIIDGKTAVAAGFNTTYNHFDKDHSSGKGNDRFDLGLQITGPAAQAALRMFDDMWRGADQRICLNFDPPFRIPWQVTCYEKSAVGDHPAEVLKYYLPGGDSNVFSLYRSRVHDAADIQTVKALAAAQESIDVIQVNFALDLVCNLNILYDICPVEISPDYMHALIEAAENGAKVRVLIKPSPFEGIENNVAIDALDKRMRDLGLEDQIEVRFYEEDMHPKVALIDDQMLIIGSQNFHYSAFGEKGGLNEYSFAVEDEQAVEDFKRAFKYMWDQGVTPRG